MSKLFEAQNGIRFQLEDDNTGVFTTIPYMNETVFTVVGTDILVTNDFDPNTDDVTIDWTLVTSPVTATPADLVEILYCWISGKIPNVITYLEPTPVVYDASCNALQNFGNQLYWQGQLLSTGGGAGILTGDNGLSENPTGNLQLGGQIIQPTTVELTAANSFQITSPITTGGNTSIYMFPVVPDAGIVGFNGSGGIFEIDSATIKMIAPTSSQLQLRTPGVSGSTAVVGNVLSLVDAVTGQVEYSDVNQLQGDLQLQVSDPEFLVFGNLRNWYYTIPLSAMTLPNLSSLPANYTIVEASFFNPTASTVVISTSGIDTITGMAFGSFINAQNTLSMDQGLWVTLIGVPALNSWLIKTYNA